LNVGVWKATCDKILLVNDDNVLCTDWDVTLEKDYDESLIITPNQIEKSKSTYNFIVNDYGMPEDFDIDAFLASEPKFRKDELTNDGGIFPVFMSKKKYMMVGGFDTVYQSPFVCDWDFFLKCELAGMKTVRSRKLNFYHFGSMSTKNSKERERFVRSERDASLLYMHKWGFRLMLNSDNSHSPRGNKVKGVLYE